MQTAVEVEHVKNEVESFSVEFYNLQEENLRLEAAIQTHGEQGRANIFSLTINDSCKNYVTKSILWTTCGQQPQFCLRKKMF